MKHEKCCGCSQEMNVPFVSECNVNSLNGSQILIVTQIYAFVKLISLLICLRYAWLHITFNAVWNLSGPGSDASSTRGRKTWWAVSWVGRRDRGWGRVLLSMRIAGQWAWCPQRWMALFPSLESFQPVQYTGLRSLTTWLNLLWVGGETGNDLRFLLSHMTHLSITCADETKCIYWTENWGMAEFESYQKKETSSAVVEPETPAQYTTTGCSCEGISRWNSVICTILTAVNLTALTLFQCFRL